MWVHRMPRLAWPSEPWGFDNGAFMDWTHAREFDGDAFLRRLDRALPVGVPFVAVVPDLVTRGRESLDFSLAWLDRLPADWPWFLAVQDGMTAADVSAVIGRFAGLFLGGSDAFKWTAPAWCKLAHDSGRLFHFARCGTMLKLQIAKRIGADSCDSSFPLWTMDRMCRLEDWWRNGDNQEVMFQ
jgi:hypothetical protein